MRVGHAIVAASIAGAAGLAVAYAVRKARSVEFEGTFPPTWVSFDWNAENSDELDSGYFDEDDVSEDLALQAFDDSSSCQTEKQFINELERRVVSVRHKIACIEIDAVHVRSGNVNALTVWEYRDLFEPTRKVDMKLFEEYLASLQVWTSAN